MQELVFHHRLGLFDHVPRFGERDDEGKCQRRSDLGDHDVAEERKQAFRLKQCRVHGLLRDVGDENRHDHRAQRIENRRENQRGLGVQQIHGSQHHVVREQGRGVRQEQHDDVRGQKCHSAFEGELPEQESNDDGDCKMPRRCRDCDE